MTETIDKLKELEKNIATNPLSLLENPEFMVQLFLALPDAIVVAHMRTGQIRMVNTQAELMFGYHHSDLIGKEIELLMPEEYRARHKQHRSQYSQHPHTRPMGIGLHLEGLNADGNRFKVEINLSPIMTRQGLFVISIIRKRGGDDRAIPNSA